jgi:hypothetical protein
MDRQDIINYLKNEFSISIAKASYITDLCIFSKAYDINAIKAIAYKELWNDLDYGIAL